MQCFTAQLNQIQPQQILYIYAFGWCFYNKWLILHWRYTFRQIIHSTRLTCNCCNLLFELQERCTYKHTCQQKTILALFLLLSISSTIFGLAVSSAVRFTLITAFWITVQILLMLLISFAFFFSFSVFFFLLFSFSHSLSVSICPLSSYFLWWQRYAQSCFLTRVWRRTWVQMESCRPSWGSLIRCFLWSFTSSSGPTGQLLQDLLT